MESDADTQAALESDLLNAKDSLKDLVSAVENHEVTLDQSKAIV